MLSLEHLRITGVFFLSDRYCRKLGTYRGSMWAHISVLQLLASPSLYGPVHEARKGYGHILTPFYLLYYGQTLFCNLYKIKKKVVYLACTYTLQFRQTIFWRPGLQTLLSSLIQIKFWWNQSWSRLIWFRYSFRRRAESGLSECSSDGFYTSRHWAAY